MWRACVFFYFAAGFRCSGFREVSGGPGLTAEEGVLWRRGSGARGRFFHLPLGVYYYVFFFNPGE